MSKIHHIVALNVQHFVSTSIGTDILQCGVFFNSPTCELYLEIFMRDRA